MLARNAREGHLVTRDISEFEQPRAQRVAYARRKAEIALLHQRGREPMGCGAIEIQGFSQGDKVGSALGNRAQHIKPAHQRLTSGKPGLGFDAGAAFAGRF